MLSEEEIRKIIREDPYCYLCPPEGIEKEIKIIKTFLEKEEKKYGS